MSQPGAVITGTDGLPPGRRALAATAQLLAAGLGTLDLSIANTALPTIAADLHANAEASIWIVSAYQIAMIATVLPFAASGEIAGHKRVYLFGMLLFTLASLGCACAWSLDSLTVARVFQGLGASAMLSVNAALVRFIYPANKFGRGMGMNVMVVAIALALGPTVTSLIFAVGRWPMLFAINIPFGLVALAIGAKTLPGTPRSKYRFDFILAALNAGAFGFLVLGVTAAAHGMALNITWPAIAAGLIMGALMLWRQAGHAAPMLPVDLFRIPVFALSTLTAICAFTTQTLAFVGLPFYFEQVIGRSQIATGFLITPWPIMVAVSAYVAGRLTGEYPTAILGGGGMAALTLGMLLLALLPAHPATADIVWRMGICGAGFGFFQAPNLSMLMGSAPPERAGGASGVIVIARLAGQTCGAALAALCFYLYGRHGGETALIVGVGFAAAATLASLARQWAPKRSAVAGE